VRELNNPYPVIYMDMEGKWQSGITFLIINDRTIWAYPSAIPSPISLKNEKGLRIFSPAHTCIF